ncbi:MAG: diguanylate cyclase [Myxococcales bacterium]|nr:diguanylate cyclase [Myxococcales bacterium]MDH5567507.1 diguanylate cyclase [Myxococcales bacterium]
MATLLVIDDSDTARSEVRSALKGTHIFNKVLEAADGFEGLKLLMAHPVDVVLCDLELPKLDGDKLLRVKDSSPGGSNIPFVYITGSTDLDRKARLILDGASDAITKPFHPPDLIARLQLHLKVKRLQDELRTKNEALERLSTVDVLTGLRTRRFVDEVFNVEFLRSQRYRTPLAVIMADLDYFKRVNDDYGHQAGDAVLRGVGEMMRYMVRRTDVAGRYGGEELIVIQPQNTLEGAAVLANRLREAVEVARFQAVDGRSLQVTMSLGVAEYHKSFSSPDDLLAAADRALYEAKAQGRNRVVVDETD